MSARIGLLLGDAAGIGPEIAARLLAGEALEPAVATVVIGDLQVLARGVEAAGVELELPTIERAADAPTGAAAFLAGPPIDPATAPVGKVSAAAGKAVLDTFRAALALAEAGELDAICFAPCNKQAMHQGGLELEDELRFFVQVLGHVGYVGEVNATGQLATTRVTSHVPLRAVADLITEVGVLQAIRLAHTTLRAAGTPRPRIGVAGLNPHAGDGGLFGREEIDVIQPAVARAQAEQIAASGPYPSDTVFIKARDGGFDAVVTMYHDQGQIAMKLMGFERGITIHAGLPIPVTTPAHGTAFDIAGRGIARVDRCDYHERQKGSPSVKHPQRLRAATKATVAITLLLAFGASGCEQSRAADAPGEDATEPADCLDVTPHEVTFVTVEPGVQLEVLDFGGSGETMVLLTGLGDNAHVWDGFAYQFTDYFRVIGITRRGFGRSDQPSGGYDIRTRARDDIEVLDQFGIDKAVFVGHSLAGSELSELGVAYPDRVDKLVFLDAADLAERFVFPDEPAGPPYADEDGRSLPIYQAASARLEGFRRPTAAACNAFTFSPTGMIEGNVTPEDISDKLLADVKKQRPVNWRKIGAPRLAIFATFSRDLRLPWYGYLSADQQALFDRAWPPIVEWHENTIQRFGAHQPNHPEPIVRELPGAPHYIYISNEAFVVREMREFLLGDVRD